MEPREVSPEFAKEVAMINREIAARREHLISDTETPEASEREVVAQAVRAAADRAGATTVGTTPNKSGSYLDQTDPETAAAINTLIDEIHKKGLSAAIADAKQQSPYVLDAFHDALVERLYAELKEHKYI